MTGPRLRPLLALLLLALLAPLCLAAPPDRLDPVESAVQQLRKAVVAQRDGSHMLLLSALRQLNDPTLATFFTRLAANEDPGIEVHCVLGMAEINPAREVSPELIAAMKSPQARTVVIQQALSSSLIHPEQIRQLLSVGDLEPLAKLWLLAKLVTTQEPFDRAMLAALASDADLDIAGLATWLLAQSGDAGAIKAYQDRVQVVPKTARIAHLREMFAAMAEYRLTTAVDWAVVVLSEPDLDVEPVYEGIHAVLEVDLKAGLKLWRQRLGTSPPHALAVRYAMLLLETGRDVPASEYDCLPQDETLLARMVIAGKAISSGGNVAAALNSLIDLNHAVSAKWALRASSKLPVDEAAKVYAHIITNLEGTKRGQADRADLALDAATKLFEIKPEAIAELLAKTEDDGLVQEAILIGLLASPSPRAGQLAATVKRIGSSRADSLALILLAKHSSSLPPDDVRQLGLIASGGGRVSEALQAQAAWLYLRHSANLDRAIKQIFPDS